jgi:hypothetical protein
MDKIHRFGSGYIHVQHFVVWGIGTASVVIDAHVR